MAKSNACSAEDDLLFQTFSEAIPSGITTGEDLAVFWRGETDLSESESDRGELRPLTVLAFFLEADLLVITSDASGGFGPMEFRRGGRLLSSGESVSLRDLLPMRLPLVTGDEGDRGTKSERFLGGGDSTDDREDSFPEELFSRTGLCLIAKGCRAGGALSCLMGFLGDLGMEELDIINEIGIEQKNFRKEIENEFKMEENRMKVSAILNYL